MSSYSECVARSLSQIYCSYINGAQSSKRNLCTLYSKSIDHLTAWENSFRIFDVFETSDMYSKETAFTLTSSHKNSIDDSIRKQERLFDGRNEILIDCMNQQERRISNSIYIVCLLLVIFKATKLNNGTLKEQNIINILFEISIYFECRLLDYIYC